MGNHELIEALRVKGEQRARRLWAEAEEEARRLREEKQARLHKARREMNEGLEHFEDNHVAERLREASEQARSITLEAEGTLARRCRRLAEELARQFGAEDHEDLLRRLCSEIPAAAWSSVTVNPDARDAAKMLFDEVEIKTDEAIGAGFILATDRSEIVLDNTMETRLQRGWPIIMPELLRSIRGKIDV